MATSSSDIEGHRMDSYTDEVPSARTITLVENLRRYGRQLQNVGLPVRITAEVLRQVEITISQLQLPNEDTPTVASLIANEVAQAQELSKEMLVHLDITTPHYARSHFMQKAANQTQDLLLQQVEKTLNGCNAPEIQKRMLQQALVTAIHGDETANVPDAEAWIARGLLTGLNRNELKVQCATRKCAKRVRQLLIRIGYNKLSELFSPWAKIGNIDPPSSLKRQKYTAQVTFAPGLPVDDFATNQSFVPLEPVDTASDAINGFQAVGSVQPGNKQYKMRGFLGLLKYRLKISELPQEQCKDIFARVKLHLDYTNWFPPRDTNELFAMGLVQGEDRTTMSKRCKTVLQKLQLAEILDSVDLEGLKAGKDWLWDGSGKLVASRDLDLHSAMDKTMTESSILESGGSAFEEDVHISDEGEVFHDCVESLD